ncbi:MAG: EamA family transporter [Okeania sp. SIO3I5]|uniref:EamA family transporter n=1 Tax=Okeania sp. SIO3I5 TaxID=2607805 RepID=UPI0013BAEAD7|nr:EamA family transporter [Okeania sp. SIO3I5]NEQ39400.1 EamA family transporter [Okeania sp. SIO3I5]
MIAIAAFVSAILFGTYYLLIEQLRSKFSATTILFLTCISGSLFTIPIPLFTEDNILRFSWERWDNYQCGKFINHSFFRLFPNFYLWGLSIPISLKGSLQQIY